MKWLRKERKVKVGGRHARTNQDTDGVTVVLDHERCRTPRSASVSHGSLAGKVN